MIGVHRVGYYELKDKFILIMSLDDDLREDYTILTYKQLKSILKLR